MPEIAKQRKIPGLRAEPDEIKDFLENLQFPPNIDRERYVWVQGTTSGINREQTHNGKTLAQTADELTGQKLQFPLTRYFMPHRVNVTGFVQRRKSPHLYDISGKMISALSIAVLNLKLTKSCWTHLGTGFVAGTGYRNLDLVDFIINPEINNKFGFKGIEMRREPLLSMIDGNKVFSERVLNSQGLPIKMARGNYTIGDDFYSFQPMQDKVAGFFANSGGVHINCDWDPLYSSSVLGVFSRAEGQFPIYS